MPYLNRNWNWTGCWSSIPGTQYFQMVPPGEIGNEQTGVMGYTFEHDGLENVWIINVSFWPLGRFVPRLNGRFTPIASCASTFIWWSKRLDESGGGGEMADFSKNSRRLLIKILCKYKKVRLLRRLQTKWCTANIMYSEHHVVPTLCVLS